MNTIAIDCGASFLKGAVLRDGNIVRQMQMRSPVVHGEEDVLKTVQIQALIPLIRQMIINLADDEKEVRLCISNEMHGFLLSYEDGMPYTDYISWQKEYGTVEIENATSVDILESEILAEDIFYTGMPLRAGLPSCNLLYLSRKGYLKNAKSKLYFYTLGDYILKILSKSEPMCHPTNAAATGLYDLRKNEWNYELIKNAGGRDIVFPKVGTAGLDFDMGKIKVHALPAIGDQQAALLGAGLNDEETLSFNLGTGAQVSKLVSEPIYSDRWQIRPYFYGKYIKTLPHLPSGRALNVYIRFFSDILQSFQVDVSNDTIWKVLLEEEGKSRKTEMICDLSFYENAVTESKTGSIHGIGEYSLTMGNLMYAVFEQMEKNFIWAADIIEEDASKVKKIVFSGGVANKISRLRENLLKHYQENSKVVIASNETFLGLYIYGQWKEEKQDE